MRVCSHHFIDKEPTYQNPYPTINMGYDTSSKLRRINTDGSRRKLEYKSSLPSPPSKRQKETSKDSTSANSLNISTNTSLYNSTNASSNNSTNNFTNTSTNNIFTKTLNNSINNNFANTLTDSANENNVDFQPIASNYTNFNAKNISLLSNSNEENSSMESLLHTPSSNKFSMFSTSLLNKTNHEDTALASNLQNFYITSTPSTSFNNVSQNSKIYQLQQENLQLQQELNNLKQQNNILSSTILQNFSTINSLKQKIKYKSNNLSKIKKEHNDCNKPMYEKLLTSDKSVDFYTGIRSRKEFDILHDSIAPFVKRRWRGYKKTSSAVIRKYKKKPQSFGPQRKLSSKDEFLLMLMKLRLALLNRDLADRFKISTGLTSSVITSWIKASSSVIGSMVYVPEYENIRATTPQRFHKMGYGDTHSILDGTEFFIETPKNLDLQKVTWSDYKHHNTLKVLICVAPNSTVVFASKAYGGSISDKELTNRSGYLDHVPAYSRIMYDKGFNLTEECAQRMINVSVPPGRRGSAQMTPAELKKTKEIANLRILVEQVIRRIKTFRILAVEYPITLLRVFDDVLGICTGLSNLRKPIYLT